VSRGARGRAGRLVNRLVVATVAAGLGAGVLGAVLLHRAQSADSIAQAHDRNRALADELAVRIDSRVDSLVGTLRLAASRDQLTSFRPTAESELRVVLRVSGTFDELTLYDGSGDAVAAAASQFLADASTVPDLRELPAPDAADVVLVFPTGAAPVAEVTVPVEAPPGNVVGALVGRSPLEVVAASLVDVGRDDQRVPLLVDGRGVVLVHRDRSRVIGGDRFPLAALASERDRSATIDLDGERRLVAVAASQRLDGSVVVEQPESSARAAADEQIRTLIVILALVMVAVVIAVILAGEVLLRPLRPLTVAVQRVGRGERGVRTRTGGHAEIGVLAGEVDRMAEALDRREEQVEELRELSLVLGSASQQSDVVRRVVAGAAKLVGADGAACRATAAEDASFGTLPHPAQLDDVATGAIRTRSAFRRSADDVHLLGVPLVGNDGLSIGAVVVSSTREPFDDEAVELLRAFASFAAVALDNARRLELQRALADELQEAIDRRRDLLGTVTHEFRTPLTCIDGFSSALLDGWERYSDDERRELVGRIAHHSAELDDLVSRFLDFAVSERGGMAAAVGPVELRPAVDATVASLAPLLADREVDVDVPPVVVAADAVLLRRALTNLLSNAAKFSAAGTPIEVRARADGTRARIEVVDHGVGLTAREAARAFEPFWRGGGATTRATRGAGLGLALVHEYVRAMGGTCGVTSEVGRGSNFYVVLPLVDAAPVGAARRDGVAT